MRTTSPSGHWSSPFASEEPRSPRAAGSCSFLRHQAETARRPLVDEAPRSVLHRSKDPTLEVIPLPFHLFTIYLFLFPYPVQSFLTTQISLFFQHLPLRFLRLPILLGLMEGERCQSCINSTFLSSF